MVKIFHDSENEDDVNERPSAKDLTKLSPKSIQQETTDEMVRQDGRRRMNHDETREREKGEARCTCVIEYVCLCLRVPCGCPLSPKHVRSSGVATCNGKAI